MSKNAEKKNRLIDIDGTVCEDIANENSHLYPTAKLWPGSVQKINFFYDQGDFIVFFTAREEKDRKVTEDWLQSNGFKYHALITGKPRGGNYQWIDNLKGEFVLFEGDWEKIL
jgi:uncharacterized HAD superfamily protein